MGRPKAIIDGEQVRKLARLGCSNVEIAQVLGCDEGTLRNRFSEFLTKGRLQTKNRLRRVQLRMALSGKYPVMTIWCAKNILGWSDSPEAGEVKAVPTELKIVRPDLSKLGT